LEHPEIRRPYLSCDRHVIRSKAALAFSARSCLPTFSRLLIRGNMPPVLPPIGRDDQNPSQKYSQRMDCHFRTFQAACPPLKFSRGRRGIQNADYFGSGRTSCSLLDSRQKHFPKGSSEGVLRTFGTGVTAVFERASSS
jgi:hypothetical protein